MPKQVSFQSAVGLLVIPPTAETQAWCGDASPVLKEVRKSREEQLGQEEQGDVEPAT